MVLVDEKIIKRQLKRLEKVYPDAKIALHYRNAFELLVASILSAQCTNVLVNKLTPAFFAAYPDPAAIKASTPEQLLPLIKGVNMAQHKAQSIHAAATILVDEFAGELPQTLAELTRLPGVARKTANVVLSNCFNIAEGIVVDTHVIRLTQRLGFTQNQDPKKIEIDLMNNLPKTAWLTLPRQLALHGRAICTAAKPKCDICPLAPDCPSAAHS